MSKAQRDTSSIDEIIQKATMLAKKGGHEYVTIEHLTCILLETEQVQNIFKQMNLDVQQPQKKIKNFLDEHMEKTVPLDSKTIPSPTDTVVEVLQQTVFQNYGAQKPKFEPVDLLVSISTLSLKSCISAAALHNAGLSSFELKKYLTNTDPSLNSNAHETTAPDGDNKSSPAEEIPTLLNQHAQKFDNLIGRDNEVNRLIQVLSRKKKNNLLFVGEPGVGKTAIVEGLVKRIEEGKVPESMKNVKVYSLDLGGALAGTKFRGDFEKKIKDALEKVRQNKGIIFIDEIHGLIGAGTGGGGNGVDAANLLKPLLTSGELRVIGATTYEEKRQIFDKDRALARRFQVVDVLEPSPSETLQIITGLKDGLEKHHKVRFTQEALQASIDLAIRYMPDRQFPDKAIDLLDESAAKISSGLSSKTNNLVEIADIQDTVSLISKINVRELNTSEKQRMMNLEGDLKNVVFGQDAAVKIISKAVKIGKAGLSGNNKPVGSFLLVGPTGVGKTEVAKQLAATMGLELVRFDMSEYMEKHSVSRLIGPPPGYVGFEQAGLLTEAIAKHNGAVLLLDEIEKAHPDVYNILLQVMDNGFLTDTKGRKVDFRNVVLLMTSNLGAQAAETRGIGFGNLNQHAEDNRMEAITQAFRPEFRNRLDSIVNFNSLTKDNVLKIVDKQLKSIAQNAKAKDVFIELSDEMKTFLSDKGFDPKMGARPLQKLMQEQIVSVLAEEILCGKLEHGGQAKFDYKNGNVEVSYISTPPKVKADDVGTEISNVGNLDSNPPTGSDDVFDILEGGGGKKSLSKMQKVVAESAPTPPRKPKLKP